jgi:hypothetical protein
VLSRRRGERKGRGREEVKRRKVFKCGKNVDMIKCYL